MLQFALKHGFVLTKVNKIVICNQKPWLREYILKNKTLRAQAVEEDLTFLARIYKDMNNMFFGKTVEQLRRRTNVIIRADDFSAQKTMSKPNYKRSTVINEDLLAIESSITKLLLNKPLYIGAAVLELSKLRMMEFHYDTMKKFYANQDQLSLCYTDTDSFIYEIKTEDVYSDMLHPSLVSQFDFSEYSPESLLFSNAVDFHSVQASNKQVLGKFKDELGDIIMKELVVLRSKLYSYTMEVPVSTKELKGTTFIRSVRDSLLGERKLFQKNIAKGVKDFIRNHNLTFADYWSVINALRKNCVKKLEVRQLHMKSTDHTIHTSSVRKVALSATDVKRYLLNAIETLPFGHKNCRHYKKPY